MFLSSIKEFRNDFGRQTKAIVFLYLGTLLTGFNMGFSAIATPGIKAERNATYSLISSIQASDEQLSWFGKTMNILLNNILQNFCLASTISIGQMIGNLLGGFLGGRYGPKRTIQGSCLFGILGWVCMTLSPYFPLLILGRIICGIGASCNTANCSLLVAQYR